MAELSWEFSHSSMWTDGMSHGVSDGNVPPPLISLPDSDAGGDSKRPVLPDITKQQKRGSWKWPNGGK